MSKIRLRRFQHRISGFISDRSVIRHQQYPTRANSIYSLFYILAISPLAALLIPFVCLRSARLRRKIEITVLAVDSEFAPVIELLEYLRKMISSKAVFDYVLVLSKYQHKSLDTLYSRELNSLIIRSRGFSRIIQQCLMLQPSKFVNRSRLTANRYFKLSNQHLEITDELRDLRQRTLEQLGLSKQKYVTMAVYTLQYDEERNARYAAKTTSLETVGEELVKPIQYLQNCNIGIVMLGSPDTRNSKIPIDFPRLSDFGYLGGPHELALASGCEYFWNDSDVGAWWLALPFRRPILTTNKPRMRLRTDFSEVIHLVVPTRYRRPDGTELTIREMLSMKSSPHKAASRGELEMIRNSPDEIVQAHREMMDQISNPDIKNEQASEAQLRSRRIFEDFPDAFPMKISTYFLLKHSYLLD